ncbi:MAG: glycosyltransferase family 4 protein [Acidimicrobiales bacterium]
MIDDRPLRIALLTYRGKPHVGGQGVYTRHLARALTRLGHHVEVFSGQPYPVIDDGIALHELPSLDIFNEHFPGRMPAFWELKDIADLVETSSYTFGAFSEPISFSVRAYRALRNRVDDFDLVQDNQSLGYGLLAIQRAGLPVMGTIHHPITVDRRLEMEHASGLIERFGKSRWYSFTKMQTRVAKRLLRILTVSESSFDDIVADHGVDPGRLVVVPVGVDPESFRPLAGIERRPGHIVTTASADVAMKGLAHLLEAVAKLRTERAVHLTVIGRQKEGGAAQRTIAELGLGDVVEFISGVPEERIVEIYAQSAVAVVPSLYEGFSLPAIEAMSTGIPLVTTTGGALPEVVGADGDTALLVEPGDGAALAAAIGRVLDEPELASGIGTRGRTRVIDRWSWAHTADKTVEQYRVLLEEWESTGRSRC